MKEKIKRPRPAKPGDICILLLPDLNEVPSLRLKQKDLISKYGGKAHETIHLTAQRFDMDKKSLPEFIYALHQGFDSYPAFSIYAKGLVQIFHPYWNTCLIRWQIQQNEELIKFGEVLESLILLNKSVPHYRAAVGWQPSMVTAVENTRKVGEGKTLEKFDQPKYLFFCKRIVVSEILGLNQFNIIDEFEMLER